MSPPNLQPPVYYNEHSPFPAQWLRELAASGAIPHGTVDGRSIEHVRPEDLELFETCHFFAGIGVWSFALEQSGWPRNGLRTWTASLPCQPISQAGKRAGINDKRHLWPVFFSLVEECKPAIILGEQVAGKDGLAWIDGVFSDLENAGYACAAVDTCAAGYGAPHKRQRLYWVAARMADTAHIKRELLGCGRPESIRWQEQVGDGGPSGPDRGATGFWGDALWTRCLDGFERPTGPGLRTVAHGAPGAVELLRAYGNALVAEAAVGFAVATREALAESHS
jgi:DNA (cytosine-5)-methyltransferase 1